MEDITIHPIGSVSAKDGDAAVLIDKKYIPALKGLDGFSHVVVVWWFDGCDNDASRANLDEKQPYKKGPNTLGVFATRSPMRPNPIAVSTAYVTYIDEDNGVVGLAYIDANDGSPVLDIKPYTPSLDRVESPGVPDWCAHWPKSCEASGAFDWDAEFNF